MARAGRKDRGLLSKMDAAGTVVWIVRLYHQGKDRRFGSFDTKTEAREFYEKAKHEQKTVKFFPERYQYGGCELVQETIDRYLLTATLKKAEKDEGYFARWWKVWLQGKRLNAITPALLDEARQALLAKRITPQRVNRYMDWLRHVLNIAIRDEKLQVNPVTKLKRFKEPTGRTRFLTPDEEATLLTAIGPAAAPWVRLAILTGMRQTEQFTLRWKNVGLERGLITLSTTKAGDVQYIPLSEEARVILRGMQAVAEAQAVANGKKPSQWVFPSQNRDEDTHVDPDNFMHTYRAAVTQAGIEWVTWHDLRHTYASRLAMNGAADSTIAALLRHSTTALVRRYAHLSQSHLKAAVEGLAAFGKADPKASPAPLPEQSADVVKGDPGSIPTVPKTGIDPEPKVSRPEHHLTATD